MDSGFIPIQIEIKEKSEESDEEDEEDIISHVILFLIKEYTNLSLVNDSYYRIPSYFNIKDIFSPNKTKPSIMAITREINRTPLKDISLIHDNTNTTKIALTISKRF